MRNSNRRFRSAQLMMANWPQAGMKGLKMILSKWPLAGFIFHSHDIVSPEWLRETTEELWSFYANQGWPAPWFAVTEEGGTVQRFRQWFDVPSPMSLGNLGIPGVSYETGSLVGRFLLSCGINWNFAPVVDVATERYSEVIGTRSFGADPDIVGQHAVAWLLGQQGTGVMSTTKHFPGHGMTSKDSHLERPLVNLDMNELEIHLEPFRKTIDAGIASIMTAHISYPRFDDHPATLSPFWLKTILREKLGFKGLVVTDAMSMKAIVRHMDPVKAATSAILAGADVIDCGGTFDQAIKMCEFLYDEMNSLAILERLKDSELRIRSHKENIPKPSDWPSAPEPQKLASIFNQLTARVNETIDVKDVTLTDHPIKIWVSSSEPTEVQEEGADVDCEIVWLNTSDPDSSTAQLTAIQNRSQDDSIVVYTENIWKHAKLAEDIEKYLGHKIRLMVAVLDPIDAELFRDVPVCIKTYGNRRVAHNIVESITWQKQDV